MRSWGLTQHRPLSIGRGLLMCSLLLYSDGAEIGITSSYIQPLSREDSLNSSTRMGPWGLVRDPSFRSTGCGLFYCIPKTLASECLIGWPLV
jgi:hypothetical protein